jgi:lipopolysaccharide transport system ATP-binding protein
MENETIISIKNIGKKYNINQQQGGYVALRDVITNVLKNPFAFLKQKTKEVAGLAKKEEFWALRKVNFEVKKGEVVGIIGHNGAGKSTLLKILSQITPPTEGEIKINGRVGSLLEVGTGFHPELSGRENIFLNGAILGMTKKEIFRKFDDIVEFAGIEKFLDTPVKHYSSGMYVRLAFSVAAHMEPDILIIDEVLAVGDAEFQKKCLGKMDDISKKEGRTVLFVSHNMGAIKNLCSRSILLENGTVKMEGKTEDVIDCYLNLPNTQHLFSPIKVKEIDVIVNKITLNAETGTQVIPFKPLKIDIEIEAERDVDQVGIEIMFSHDDTSGVVFRTNTKTIKNLDIQIKKGKNKISCLIESFNLCSGRYQLGFGLSLLMVKYYFYDLALLSFDVSEVMIEQGSLPTEANYSHVYLDHDWIIEN